jgi:hypothetical protein
VEQRATQQTKAQNPTGEDVRFHFVASNLPIYPIVIYPYDEGGYVAEIPALKGCLAQGETLPDVQLDDRSQL